MIDTKATESDAFPFSKICDHQVEEMFKHAVLGGKSGYVIWFRKTDDVAFFSSMLLMSLLAKRGSLKVSSGDNVHYLGKFQNFKPEMIFGKLN